MANPDRDTVYTNDGTNRTIYSREGNSTGWFVGIIVALALLAIAYLVFSANSQPNTAVDVNNTPAVTAPLPGTDTTVVVPPADTTIVTPNETAPTAPAASTPAPATSAPASPAPSVAPSAATSAPVAP